MGLAAAFESCGTGTWQKFVDHVATAGLSVEDLRTFSARDLDDVTDEFFSLVPGCRPLFRGAAKAALRSWAAAASAAAAPAPAEPAPAPADSAPAAAPASAPAPAPARAPAPALAPPTKRQHPAPGHLGTPVLTPPTKRQHPAPAAASTKQHPAPAAAARKLPPTVAVFRPQPQAAAGRGRGQALRVTAKPVGPAPPPHAIAGAPSRMDEWGKGKGKGKGMGKGNLVPVVRPKVRPLLIGTANDVVGAPLQQLPPKWLCGTCGFNNKPHNEICGGAGRLGCKLPRPADPVYDCLVEPPPKRPRPPAPSEPSPLSTEEIVDQVRRRQEAKRVRDFVTADSIESYLRDNGVRTEDKKRFWHEVAGDRRGRIPGFQELGPPKALEGDDVPGEELAEVQDAADAEQTLHLEAFLEPEPDGEPQPALEPEAEQEQEQGQGQGQEQEQEVQLLEEDDDFLDVC